MSMKTVHADFGASQLPIEVPQHAEVVEFQDPEFLADPVAELNRVLDRPQASPPLRELVRPGMKVAIAFDDPTRPALPVQTIIPVLVKRLLRHGVALRDIRLINATGNHRKYAPTELAAYLGAETFETFWRHGQILNHDCEDPAQLMALGVTDSGGLVEHNRTFLEADLPIYVGNVSATAWGGYTGTGAVVGLASTRSITSHHGHHVIARANSLSAEHRIAAGRESYVGHEHLLQHGHGHGHPHGDQAAPRAGQPPYRGFKEEINAFIERAIDKRIFYVNAVGGTRGRLAGFFAGWSPEVEPPAWELADSFSRYPVSQADVLVVGMGPAFSYGSSHNTLIAAVGMTVPPRQWLNKPVLREGGVVIGLCPSTGVIDADVFPSYQEVIDLYGRYHDASRLVDHQDEVIHRPEYQYRYRHGHAYPGAHPFWLFYEMQSTFSSASQVILAGAANPGAFRALGITPAKDFASAWKLATRIVGPDPRTVVAPNFWSRRGLKFEVVR